MSNPSGRLTGWDAWRKTALCILRRKRNIAQLVINAYPGGTRSVAPDMSVLRQASRRICNPPSKNDLTSLCSGDLQSPTPRLQPAYQQDRGIANPLRWICLSSVRRSGGFAIRRQKNDLTSLCFGDMLSPAPRQQPAYRWDRGITNPQRRICPSPVRRSGGYVIRRQKLT